MTTPRRSSRSLSVPTRDSVSPARPRRRSPRTARPRKAPKTPTATTFALNLNERATLIVDITGKVKGHRVAPGTLVRAGRGPGKVSIPFSGRIGATRLAPGSYVGIGHRDRRRRQPLPTPDRDVHGRRKVTHMRTLPLLVIMAVVGLSARASTPPAGCRAGR